MNDSVRVRAIKRLKLNDRFVREGEEVTLSLSEARYLWHLGWVSVVKGDLALPVGAEPTRGLHQR